MNLLLDTSIIIDHLRRKDKENSLLFQLSTHENSIALLTHTELYSGKNVWKQKRAQEEIKEILTGLRLLPFTEPISKEAGKLKAMHPNMSIVDAIIASTAITYDIPLVTLNVKDFQQVKDLQLLPHN